MPASMTGFGSGRAELEGRRVLVEIRSVNHRYLDIRWHVFGDIDIVERSMLESRLRERVHRGHLDIRVVVETDGGGMEHVEVDESAAEELVRSSHVLAGRLGLRPIESVPELLTIPGVVRRRSISLGVEHRERLVAAFDGAVSELTSMRDREGAATGDEIDRHLQRVDELVASIRELCEPGVNERLERMKRRLLTLLEGHTLDEARLLQEAAVLADRVDITEELERLKSHLEQMRKLLSSAEPVGRRIDFLLQEMNREANTIGSKSNEVDVAHLVVELKAEVEKMREQSQNIE